MPPENRAAAYLEPFAAYLRRRLEGLRAPAPLKEAIIYATAGGGKHLRPLLLLTAGHAHGLDTAELLPAAAAIECVHAYSLIHDDLPCMDDSPLRRGKPSCWAAFGEATAVLAGDSLLSLAFAFLSEGDYPAALTRELAVLSGPEYLAAGQTYDILQRHRQDPAMTERLAVLKTGSLFRFCFTAPAYIAAASPREITAWSDLADGLALTFQYLDDLADARGDAQKLGKPVGQDAGKYTLYHAWAQTAQERCAAFRSRAEEILAPYGGAADDLRSVIALMTGAAPTEEDVPELSPPRYACP